MVDEESINCDEDQENIIDEIHDASSSDSDSDSS